MTWSTCGEDSQAAIAAENGGYEAGWILVDDLLREPGITLGDHALRRCDEAVPILSRADMAVGPDQVVQSLAREVLLTELNLLAGSETCDAAETAVGLGQLLLASSEYGKGAGTALEDRERSVAGEVTDVLEEYNRGTLCG